MDCGFSWIEYRRCRRRHPTPCRPVNQSKTRIDTVVASVARVETNPVVGTIHVVVVDDIKPYMTCKQKSLPGAVEEDLSFKSRSSPGQFSVSFRSVFGQFSVSFRSVFSQFSVSPSPNSRACSREQQAGRPMRLGPRSNQQQPPDETTTSGIMPPTPIRGACESD